MSFVVRAGWLRAVSVIAIVLCYAASAGATTAITPTDRQIINDARAIITGRVIATECGMDSSRNMIYTYVTVRVSEVIKGSITTREVVLKEPGGQYQGYYSHLEGAPQFTRGDRVLLYLDTWFDGSLRVHQMFLGQFSISKDRATGKDFAVRATPGANVEVLANTLGPGGREEGAATSKMELASYIKMVRKTLAANLAQSNEFEAEHYSGIEIQDKPAEYRQMAASGGLEPQYHLFSPGVRWFQPDSGQPVPFTVNLDQAPSPNAMSDVTSAMNAWSNVSGSSMRVVSGGTTSSCLSGGGPSLIYFDNCDGGFSAGSGCAGILGIGGYTRAGGASTTIGGVTFVQLQQSFVSINPGADCYFSNDCNLAETLTHEIGHGLGLAHSWDPTYSDASTPASATQLAATMYYVAHFDGRCAVVGTDDVNAITFVYPGSPGTISPPGISTSALPGGTTGTAYSQTLTATGGTPPYSWSLASGSGPLPTGLSLSSGGVISGTPSASGTYTFSVQVTDSASKTAQTQLFISVLDPGTTGGGTFGARYVSQDVPTSVQPGASFTVTFTYVNTGTSPWNASTGVVVGSQNPPNNTIWGGDSESFGSFSIPAGVEVSASFVVFAPSTPGIYNFQWQMEQPGGIGFFGDMTQNVAITVGQPAPVLSITTSSLPQIAVGAAYNQQVAATGGVPPYSWSIVSGALPPGLSLGQSTGMISGSATSVGTYNFTVQVSDSKSTKVQTALSIGVIAGPLSITTTTLPQVQVGASYNQQMAATGGSPPYTWSVVSGTLPPGLTLGQSTGLISGSATSAGTYNFTVQVSDSTSTKVQTALSIGVIGAPLSITTTTLPQVQVGASYNQQMAASGGSPPYTWSMVSGALPPGLSLGQSTGMITGSPTAVGTYNFTVQVSDSKAANVQTAMSIAVIGAPLAMSAPPLVQGQVGSQYSQQLGASGGAPPYVWAIVAGALPPGIGLGQSSGVIGGTPTAFGTYNFTIQLSDAQSTRVQTAMSITVIAAPLGIAPVTPSTAMVGNQFTQQLTASGGLPPYTWAISSGSLPPGITLNFASGTVSGVPTSVGNYTSQITVTDAQFNSVNAVLNINVTPPVPVPLISGLIYKKVHHKLVINGQNFNAAATVLVDGFLAPIKTTAATSIIVKPVSLTAGDHTVQVINPNGVSSGPVVITVP